MTIDIEMRKLIKRHYEAGKNVNFIYQSLSGTVSKRTIYRWIRTMKQTNTIEARTSPGRPRSVRTKPFIAKVKRNVNGNKKNKSAREMASQFGCSRGIISKVIHEDLGLKTYKKQNIPKTSSSHIERRKTCTGWLRKKFDEVTQQKILFSDEKVFDGDGQINLHNDVVYAESRKAANMNCGLFSKTKYPFKVMVWVGLTYNGPTTPVFLPPKTSFDSDFYTRKVLPVIKKCGEELIGADFVYQQDGASCHTSVQTLEELENSEISFIAPNHWPPNSPDLNPLDYFFWSETARRLKQKKYKNRAELTQKIKETIKEIPINMVRQAINQFIKRVRAIERREGGLITDLYT